MPDDKWGERPMGFRHAQPRRGPHRDGADRLSRETLPGFKAPSAIEFCELPKTSTGKVKKFELRERARTAARAPAAQA